MKQDKREIHQLMEKTGNRRGECEKRTPDVSRDANNKFMGVTT